MIPRDNEIIKVITEAVGNRYDPSFGPATNTLGFHQYDNAVKVTSRLNWKYRLSLTVKEVLECPNIAALIKLVETYLELNTYTSWDENVSYKKEGCEGHNKEMLNIVITGRSGAGKSSFLNYLIGEEHFKVGEGTPVTQAYFEDYSFIAPDTGVHYHLFDTKGIEPTTTAECRQTVLNEINKRERLSLFEWIHTVYYCFDASAKRIQPFEISFINELKEYVSIVILLTKKDLVSVDDLNALVLQIEKEVGTNIQVVPVCSVEQRTRKGTSHREGKEEVLKASFLGLWEKLANSLPQKIIEPILIKEKVDIWKFATEKQKKEYEREFPETKREIDKVNNYELSIDFFKDYPNWDDFAHADFVVSGLILSTNMFFIRLGNIISSIDVELIWKKNELIHNEIFEFYKKVNKVKPKVLFTNEAVTSLRELKFNFTDKISELEELYIKIDKCYKKWLNAIIFDSSETADLINCYSSYRKIITTIGNELNLKINKFLTSYRAELLQYGQYCIKKHVKKEQQKLIESEDELDSDEKTYYNVVLACLKDHAIGESERFMLDQLIKTLDLSYYRAGLIEDFARNMLKTTKL